MQAFDRDVSYRSPSNGHLSEAYGRLVEENKMMLAVGSTELTARGGDRWH